MLGGGLPESSTTMIMGPSGTGKTTLGLQFLSKCSEAVPGLLFGFYETLPRPERQGRSRSARLWALWLAAARSSVLWQPPTDDLLDAYGERLLQGGSPPARSDACSSCDGLGAFQQAAGSEPGRIGNFSDDADERDAGPRSYHALYAGGSRSHGTDNQDNPLATCRAWLKI